MADSIQFRRGLRSTVKPLPVGMPGFIEDEERLVIGKGDGTNTELPNKADMDNINSQMADIVNGSGIFVEKFPVIAPEADDAPRINRSIEYAKNNGYGNVILSDRQYEINSGYIRLYNNINLIGQGIGITILHHTGNAQCILYPTADTEYNLRSSVMNLTIEEKDNANTSQSGIEIQDTYGFFIFNVVIQNNKGKGLIIAGVNKWCEGTTLMNVAFRYNKSGIVFRAGSGSTGSFAYTRFYNVSINMGADSIGIDFGGDENNLPPDSKMYHSVLDVKMWHDSGDNSTFVKIRDNISLSDNEYNIVGEDYSGGTGNIGLDIASNSIVLGKGNIDFWGTVSNNLSGKIRMLSLTGKTIDNISGTDSDGNSYKMQLTGDSVNDSLNGIGTYQNGSNVTSSFATIRNHSGNYFKIRRVPDSGKVSDGIDVFKVDMNGGVYPSNNLNGAGLLCGSGSPNGNIYAKHGTVYFRSDSENEESIYVNMGSEAVSNQWKKLSDLLKQNNPSLYTGSEVPSFLAKQGSIYTQIDTSGNTHIFINNGDSTWIQHN